MMVRRRMGRGWRRGKLRRSRTEGVRNEELQRNLLPWHKFVRKRKRKQGIEDPKKNQVIWKTKLLELRRLRRIQRRRHVKEKNGLKDTSSQPKMHRSTILRSGSPVAIANPFATPAA